MADWDFAVFVLAAPGKCGSEVPLGYWSNQISAVEMRVRSLAAAIEVLTSVAR
jgi:hypothetical protein